MIEFVNENYLSIVDYDASSILPDKLIETGELVYNFLCIDCFNVIIPRFLMETNCLSLESFDLLIMMELHFCHFPTKSP